MARLPILMYHNVSDDESKSLNLTLSSKKFEQQLQYIVAHKYTSFFVSELENKTKIPQKSIVITFDDVTQNQLLYALPLLIKYQVKATFFIPFSFIGATDKWNDGTEKIMTIEQLKSLHSDYIELGQHSYNHKKYASLSIKEIQEDFDNCNRIISDNQLKVYPSLAYPYGNYPKKGVQKEDFFQSLEKNKIEMAFRIGNRVNRFPFKNKYEIQRIDIKGEDSLFVFKWKLKFGKFGKFGLF